MKVLSQYKSKTSCGEDVYKIEVHVGCKKEAKQIRKNLTGFYKCIVEANINCWVEYDLYTGRESGSDGYLVIFSIFPKRPLRSFS